MTSNSLLSYEKLDNVLELKLEKIKNCHTDTRAYMHSTMLKFLKSDVDFSKESITVMYCNAVQQYNFRMYQDIADWLFFVNSFYPASLDKASPHYYTSLARLSYYKCYQIVNKKWPLFNEMADRFEYFTSCIKEVDLSMTQLIHT